MSFLRKLFKRSTTEPEQHADAQNNQLPQKDGGSNDNARTVLIAETKKQAKKIADNNKHYVKAGGFNSLTELEASGFIALMNDLTGGLTDEAMVSLVVEQYQLSANTVRGLLRDFKTSRR